MEVRQDGKGGSSLKRTQDAGQPAQPQASLFQQVILSLLGGK